MRENGLRTNRPMSDKKDRESRMGRMAGEAQAPVAELQAPPLAPPSVPQGPEGTWRRAQETPWAISKESKRTRKMPEYWRLANSILIFKRQEKQIPSTNHKTGEPAANLYKHGSCVLGEADFRACREGRTKTAADHSVGKPAEDRHRQCSEEETQVANKEEKIPQVMETHINEIRYCFSMQQLSKDVKTVNVKYWQRHKEISTLISKTCSFL